MADKTVARDLGGPDFEHPPVVETALGFLFAPISGWDVLHYGQLWEKFRAEYPSHEIKQAIGQVQLQIGSDPQADFGSLPIRCWFISKESTQLVQVQNSCFIRNWRKTEGSQEYLHYKYTRENFQRDWAVFLAFLSEQSLPLPEVWQCEVTYTNHFVRGQEWETPDDLAQIYDCWKHTKQAPLLSKLQMHAFTAAYSIPDSNGRLQFVSQPGVRKSDGKEIVQLSITASGRPKSSSAADLFSFLDVGHWAVVNGFKDFTAVKMHKIWGIR